MIPALLVLEKLGREGRRLSEILAPLRERYHISGEINSRVDDVERALARIAERYRDGRLGRLDGVSVDYDDWHFNVRPSNTEPLLRLNLEAATPRRDGAPSRRGARPSSAAEARRPCRVLTPPRAVAIMPGSSASRRA